MKCFNHNENDAVTFCKACGKGLCKECLHDITLGFTCKNNKCIERGETINKILDNNTRVLQTANKQIKSAGFFGIIAGIAFIIFALFAYKQYPGSFLPYFLGVIGGLSLFSSILRLQRRRLYPEENNKKN